MINKFTKILLVLTSLAPILLTYWFVSQVQVYDDSINLLENIQCNYLVGFGLLITTVVLALVCAFLLIRSKKELELIPVSISEIKTADNESLAFILVYLLPLANQVSDKINVAVLIFVGILFFFTVSTSNAYHFNPLLSFLGYHFYEVKLENGVTYILLSKNNISDCKKIKTVSQLTEYMIIEK